MVKPETLRESAQEPNARISKSNVSSLQTLKVALVAAGVIALAAISAHVSQLTLSPVYGSVPTSTFHRQGVMAAALLGLLAANRIKAICGAIPAYILPVLAWTIPVIQHFLFGQSNQLGPVIGPVTTELCTIYPLITLSIASAILSLEELDLSCAPSFVSDHGRFLGTYILFVTVLKTAGIAISHYVGSSILMTRTGLQYLLAAVYSICLPSRWLLLALPSLFFNFGYNIHFPTELTTARANMAIQSDKYALLHRQESLTGYISVLENTELLFRAMRCDHSLLGGEWIPPPGMPKQPVRDPIYAIFIMLEAIRLIDMDNGEIRPAGPGTNALVIGLGIGTTPAALVAHGINTTVVEIDPAVHSLATKYFDFPAEATSIIEDATTFVQREIQSDPVHQYDFVVHDVFTGGVEPADLFTLDFLHGLRDLLKDDGVIAINYAGDLNLPSAGLIVRTILSTFPSCRVFREGEAPVDSAGDFTNMVIFCKKRNSQLEFRKPNQSDFLGSVGRESYMLPKFEIQKEVFRNKNPENPEVLGKEQVRQLQAWHSQSAIGHWNIMRTVLPAAVWENW